MLSLWCSAEHSYLGCFIYFSYTSMCSDSSKLSPSLPQHECCLQNHQLAQSPPFRPRPIIGESQNNKNNLSLSSSITSGPRTSTIPTLVQGPPGHMTERPGRSVRKVDRAQRRANRYLANFLLRYLSFWIVSNDNKHIVEDFNTN